MKLVTFERGAARHIGDYKAKTGLVLDLTEASGNDPAFATMMDLIDGGEAALTHAREMCADAGLQAKHAVPEDRIRLLAPLPVPRQIRDFSVFPGHIKQAPRGMRRLAALARGDKEAAAAAVGFDEVPEIYRSQPVYYLTNRFSVIGPDSVVAWPRYSRVMDFECEFAVVIGGAARDASVEDAGSHIFGYTIYNDFSARDTQMVEMQSMLGPAKGKSFDYGNAIGPWIVTVDEVADPHNLAMEARVNGEIWGRGSSADMLFTFEEMIAYVSRDETIHAGELFGSGTMGNGCGLELGRFLADGDVVELEIEGLGVLRNTIKVQR